MSDRRIRQMKASPAVREMIGRTGTFSSNLGYRGTYLRTIDQTRPDYFFWDQFRRGEAQGYRLAAQVASPIASVTASWIWGGGVRVELRDQDKSDPNVIKTNELLDQFMQGILGLMATFTEDVLGLGDGFIVVNSDGSLSFTSPDTVELEYDPTDWRQVTKVTIRTRTPSSNVTDVYTAEKRTVTLEIYGAEPQKQVYEYENLIGCIPVVHFANDRGVNEVFGRPIYEALLHLFARYDDLITKALDGAELMGNPMPTFEGLKNVQETMDSVSTPANAGIQDEYNVDSGERRIDWDTLPALFIGEGGSFKFSAPSNGFTGDIRDMLKSLFFLILDRSRLPEVVWGNQVDGARATGAEQMKTFHMYIDGRRLQFEGGDNGGSSLDGLHKLVDLWLRVKRLSDPSIVLGPVGFIWAALSSIDRQLQLQWTQYLRGESLLTDLEVLRQSGLVENPQEELDRLSASPSTVKPEEVAKTGSPEALTVESDLEPKGPFYVALNLGDNPDLVDLQRRLQQMMSDDTVEWNNPDQFHTTLVYAPAVTSEQAENIRSAIEAVGMPDLELAVGSLHTFDNLGNYALHFRLRRNEALIQYQAELVEIFVSNGVQISSHSQPGSYIPHITMGYSKSRPSRVTFDGKVRVVPQDLTIDSPMLDASEDDDQLSPTVEGRRLGFLTPLRELIQSPRVLIASEAGSLYGRHLIESGVDEADVHRLVQEQFQRIVVSEAIQSTRLDFEGFVEELLEAALAGRVNRQKFKLRLMQLIRGYAGSAYRDGLRDAGVETELDEVEEDELEKFVRQQRSYVSNLTDAIYADGRVTKGEIENKAAMWFNMSVYPMYFAGLASGSKNSLFEWVMNEAKENCETCQYLNGQKRRMKFWRSAILPKDPRLKCKGFNCGCNLVPTSGKASSGRFPKHIFAETHACSAERCSIQPLVSGRQLRWEGIYEIQSDSSLSHV